MPISKMLRMMNPVAVRSSSLALVDYDGLRAILQVVFRDGTAYQYAGVPARTFHGLLQADSKGAYFNQHIRGLFPHEMLRVAEPVASDSPPA
jgi:hypothetical protein